MQNELEFYSRAELEQSVEKAPRELWAEFWAKVDEAKVNGYRTPCWMWRGPEPTYCIGPYRLPVAEIAWAYDHRRPTRFGVPKCGNALCIKPSHAEKAAS